MTAQIAVGALVAFAVHGAPSKDGLLSMLYGR
jgi:hypothetical protein